MVPIQKIVTDIRIKNFGYVIFYYCLLEFKEDFGQYDNHNICSLASKTTAFITVSKNYAGYARFWLYLWFIRAIFWVGTLL